MGRAVKRPTWTPHITAQVRTAAVAAVVFVVTAALLLFVPVPYVMYSPGNAYDIFAKDEHGRPTVAVDGVTTYPISGELRMTTVSVTRSDARLTLPEVLFGHVAPSRDVLPRSSVYPDEDKSPEQVRTEEQQMMDTSQQEAIVAAVRAADMPIEERPVIAGVITGGPADGILVPGDFIMAVDGERVRATSDVPDRVQTHRPGDDVTLSVIGESDENPQDVTVPVEEGPDGAPRIGVTVSTGYRYEPDVTFGVKESIGGPSAGLIFALGIYDQLTPGDLVAGRDIAGTGTIDVDGNVGPIGGIREKIHGAQDAGAQMFLVPGENCPDVRGMATDIDLVRVDTLDGAIDALSGDAALPRC